MLTEQEVIEAFINKVSEVPDATQVEMYKNYTLEDLNKALDRRLAIDQDPTFYQRVAEDYLKFLYATPEERSLWKPVEPIPQNK